MPYTRRQSEVTEEMPCRKCGQWIPSDEAKWIKHVVRYHDVQPGPYAHNIARMYPDRALERGLSAPTTDFLEAVFP